MKTVTDDDLWALAWHVFTAHLTTDPQRAGEALAGEPAVLSSVAITGAWKGHVAIRCSYATAQAMTVLMLDLDQPWAAPDDVVDGVGEIANILAGNLKSLVPQPSLSALPQVVIGEAEVLWPGASPVAHVHVRFGDHSVGVEVMEHDPA
jgi:chemotaxis protein CheX